MNLTPISTSEIEQALTCYPHSGSGVRGTAWRKVLISGMYLLLERGLFMSIRMFIAVSNQVRVTSFRVRKIHNLQGQHFVPASCEDQTNPPPNVSFTTLGETNMAIWYDLPREIQHSILSIYCEDFVTDFSDSLEVDPWGTRPYHLAKELKTLAWPEPPTPLVFFASALKTCPITASGFFDAAARSRGGQ